MVSFEDMSLTNLKSSSYWVKPFIIFNYSVRDPCAVTVRRSKSASKKWDTDRQAYRKPEEEKAIKEPESWETPALSSPDRGGGTDGVGYRYG